jgi:hypothetical protein
VTWDTSRLLRSGRLGRLASCEGTDLHPTNRPFLDPLPRPSPRRTFYQPGPARDGLQGQSFNESGVRNEPELVEQELPVERGAEDEVAPRDGHLSTLRRLRSDD